MRLGGMVFVLVLALVVGGCAGQAGPPLRISSSADAATAISIPGLGPCESESDASAGKTIDPGRPVVVLVHGCKSSAGRFKTLARVFEAQQQQAICFSYDHRDSLEDSSSHLVTALQTLERHLRTREITILGHSQGGLIARRALVRTRQGVASPGEPFRYQLVTVSSPFNGIGASADCGSLFLHVVTLGVTVAVCQIAAGAMWTEIYPQASFMRSPGTLGSHVERHIKIVTDERDTCRQTDGAGRCAKSDFVFSLPEQYTPAVDGDLRVESEQVRAGHVEIVGESGLAPEKLIRALQKHHILAEPPPDRREAFAEAVARLYR